MKHETHDSNSVIKSKAALISAMVLFGTIGVFRRSIPLPSGIIAMARGMIGTLFLLVFIVVRRKSIAWDAVKNNLLWLLLSGLLIAFNWIFLFEAFNYTTVAVATLAYYMAPVFVILLSPLVFRERLTLKKLLCVLTAFAGMVLVSGVTRSAFSDVTDGKGILFGLGAAVFYAGIALINKRIDGVSVYERTIVQLFVSAVVLLPYNLISGSYSGIAETLTPLAVLLTVILGIVHTGMAYALYFGSMHALKAQTIALYSYIDPVLAVLLSALLLHERIGVAGILGAVLILGATFFGDIAGHRE